MASHDMAEVEALCDRIAILNDGSIVFCGTASELTDTLGRKYFIHLRTQAGDKSFETDNIEDALISLLSELKQKKSMYWILRLIVARWNNISSKWQGGTQNERVFI